MKNQKKAVEIPNTVMIVKVIDKEGYVLGKITPQVGMLTANHSTIEKVNHKSVILTTHDGFTTKVTHNDRYLSMYQTQAKKFGWKPATKTNEDKKTIQSDKNQSKLYLHVCDKEGRVIGKAIPTIGLIVNFAKGCDWTISKINGKSVIIYDDIADTTKRVRLNYKSDRISRNDLRVYQHMVFKSMKVYSLEEMETIE